jgi:preprotein translocase subunit SecF
MRELIKSTIAIDFMSKRLVCALISLVAFAGSVFLFIQKGDTKYGTDFSGGHEFLVSFTGAYESDSIRKGLEGQGLTDVRVQRFQGAKNEYSIRLSEVGDVAAIRSRVEKALQGAFGDAARIEKTDYVGPTVGAELRRSALLAVALATVGMLLYIAIRFEFAVGLGTIVALIHDVTIATGIYLLSGHVIGMATLAGALTIVGYSVNDTVVIFDRVREERKKRRSYTMKGVVNEALNFTLSRTVITHVLTLFSALALYIVGTGEIKDLSLYLVAGIILGAYSTMFVVSPIVVWWEGRKLENSKVAKAA